MNKCLKFTFSVSDESSKDKVYYLSLNSDNYFAGYVSSDVKDVDFCEYAFTRKNGGIQKMYDA